MAKAKTAPTSKTAPKVAASHPYVDAEGFLCLHGELLWKFRAVDAEYRNLVLGVEAKRNLIAEEIKKHPELAQMLAERDAITQQANAYLGEVRAVQAEIEKALSVKLQECTIDDKTGRVFQLVDGKAEPMLPPGTPKKPVKKATKKAST
jgi:hypothetical protein